MSNLRHLDAHAAHQRDDAAAPDLHPLGRRKSRSMWLPANGNSRCSWSIRRMGRWRDSNEKAPGLVGRGPIIARTDYFSAASAFAIRPMPATTVAFGSAV